MKPIIIQNSKIPVYLSLFINISAITLFPFIISRDEMSDTTIRHEIIHIEQQRELLVIFFYILYVWYWLKGKAAGMTNDEAYMNIPFEQEAYRKMYDEDYPIKRQRHAWRQYIN
jgi:cbb3-type cytochrome oxidase subunit 3